MILSTRQRRDILEACRAVAEEENLRVTISETAKAAALTGVGVFVGGLLAGPIGLAVGGTITSLMVANRASGKFKSVVEILMEMTDEQKEKLVNVIVKAFRNIELSDCVKFATLVLAEPTLNQIVVVEVGNFLRDEMSMRIQNLKK